MNNQTNNLIPFSFALIPISSYLQLQENKFIGASRINSSSSANVLQENISLYELLGLIAVHLQTYWFSKSGNCHAVSS